MKKYRIKIEETAWQSINRLIDFISFYNINYSQKILKNILKSIQSLEYFPNRNQRLSFNSKYRRMFFNNHYVIIYSVNEIQRTVYIRYLFSTKQNYHQFIS